MTYPTMPDAMRAMEKLFRDAWIDDDVPANKLPCDYPGTEFNVGALTKSSVWARFRIQHYDAGQSSLANVNGKRRYERSGNIIVQVFVPQASGVIIAYQYAEKVINAYEGREAPGGAWFRNVRPVEIGNAEELEGETNSGLWYQINVFADFEYEQLK